MKFDAALLSEALPKMRQLEAAFPILLRMTKISLLLRSQSAPWLGYFH
jgi:hypothetical protein